MSRSTTILIALMLACYPARETRPESAPGRVTAPAPSPGPGENGTPGQNDGDEGEDCHADAQPEVVAVVNGEMILKAELDERTGASVRELEEYLNEAREKGLYLEINSKLLEQESRKRGIASTQILEEEVTSKVSAPTEDDARAFYTENKERLGNEFSLVRERIIDYLRGQRESDRAGELAQRLRAAAEISILVEDLSTVDHELDSTRVVAIVNGEEITLEDLAGNVGEVISKVEQQIYELQRRTVDVLVNDLLLHQEAHRREMTVQELLDVEVTGKTRKVTEKDAQDFYLSQKDRIDGDFANPADRIRIVEYLQELEKQKAEMALARRLRDAATIDVHLAEPERSAHDISIDNQPSRGRADAKVTVVEFIDYECPSCRNLHDVLEGLVNDYADRVNFVARDFPLTRHAHAYKAAIAAEAARRQGKYWEYVAVLFQNQSTLEVDDLKRFARELRLDDERFDRALDLEDLAVRMAVDADRRDGLRLGVKSTPTVFVNGRRVEGRTREALVEAIELALP